VRGRHHHEQGNSSQSGTGPRLGPPSPICRPVPPVPRPPLRKKLSIASGNLIQAAGLAAGAALLALAAAMTGPGPVRLAVALLGFLVIYDCSHAIGHYLAGRAVGIRFRFYGIRGTDHPEDYPPGFRQLMSATPFWSVVTDKTSSAPPRRGRRR
jgi:hypothetical protein